MQPSMNPMDIFNNFYDKEFFATHIVEKQGDQLVSKDAETRQDVHWSTGFIGRTVQWWYADMKSPDQVNSVFVDKFTKILEEIVRNEPNDLNNLKNRLTHLIENSKAYESFKNEIFSEAYTRPYGLASLEPFIQEAVGRMRKIDQILAPSSAEKLTERQQKMEKITQALGLAFTHLLKKDPNFLKEIFRIEGEGSKITELTNALNTKNVEEIKPLLEQEQTPHNIAKAIARTVRDLKPPLISSDDSPFFMAAADAENNEQKVKILKSAIRRLPPENRVMLTLLLTYLRELSQKGEITLMNSSNLSRVWAPNLFQAATVEQMMADLEKSLNLTQLMIENDLS